MFSPSSLDRSSGHSDEHLRKSSKCSREQDTNCWEAGTPSCQILLFYGILFRKLPLISGSGIAPGGSAIKIEQETSAAASGCFVLLERAHVLLGTEPGRWILLPMFGKERGAFLQDAPVNSSTRFPHNLPQLPGQAWRAASAFPDPAPRPA